MLTQKTDIISQLQKEILRLQGFRQHSSDSTKKIDLGPINNAFPNQSFPLGAMHEFLCKHPEDSAPTKGFISCLVSGLMINTGVCVWVSHENTMFPPGLKTFGIEPDRVIFINVRNKKDILWVIEETLKCDDLAAVVGEIQELSFTNSRRFQLAVEKSRVTGFIICNGHRNSHINACVSRWKISSLQTDPANHFPGIGFPRWNIELVKIRNGKPGSWQLEWSSGRFHPILSFADPIEEFRRKAG